MGLPKGIQKLIAGTGISIANPDGPTSTITNTGGGGVLPATTVTGPDSFGDSAVVGTGTKYARDDHDHGLPAAPGLPAWFQSGSGSPVGSVTPNTVGGLYFDTSGVTGLWVAFGATSADWSGLGNIGNEGFNFFGSGSVDIANSEGSVAVYATNSADNSGQALLSFLAPNGTTTGLQFDVMCLGGSPVGVLTPSSKGALCVDRTTPALWQSTGTLDTDWQQISAPANSVSLIEKGPFKFTFSDKTALLAGVDLWTAAAGDVPEFYFVSVPTTFFDGGTPATVQADSAPTSVPLTIVAAVNDTFVYNGPPGGTASPRHSPSPRGRTTPMAISTRRWRRPPARCRGRRSRPKSR